MRQLGVPDQWFRAQKENRLWAVEAADQLTAVHIAELFHSKGNEKVKLEVLPAPATE